MSAPAVDVREHPILFSGPMVRAILDGRKSQTRRVVSDATSQGNYRASEMLLDDPGVFADPGPSPAGNPGPYLHVPINCAAICARRGWETWDCDPTVIDRLYPRYFPGDRLWVREAWAQNWNQTSESGMDRSYAYRADGETRAVDNGVELPWRPSIHMPRWASRLTLEITDVRVERVQEITEADAIAEGIEPERDGFKSYETILEGPHTGKPHPHAVVPNRAARTSYAELWDSLNAKRGYPWSGNCWVWVLEFARVGP